MHIGLAVKVIGGLQLAIGLRLGMVQSHGIYKDNSPLHCSLPRQSIWPLANAQGREYGYCNL